MKERPFLFHGLAHRVSFFYAPKIMAGVTREKVLLAPAFPI